MILWLYLQWNANWFADEWIHLVLSPMKVFLVGCCRSSGEAMDAVSGVRYGYSIRSLIPDCRTNITDGKLRR